MSSGIGPLPRAGGTPIDRSIDRSGEDTARKLAEANRDFQALFLTEFLKPLTRELAGDRADEAGLLSGGLDHYDVFWNEALAQNLMESWPLPEIARPETNAQSTPSKPASAPIPGPTPGSLSKASQSLPDELLHRAGRMFALPVNLLRAVVLTESGGKSEAVSPKGAVGWMQVMPGTAKEMGVKDASEPWSNVFAGAKYLSRMLDRFGDVKTALAAYNAGPGAVDRHGGVPPFAETRAYVQRVLQWKETLDERDPSNS